MLPTIAYIDIRPLILIVGLPAFVGIVVLIACLISPTVRKARVAWIAGLSFFFLFFLLYTGAGPFIGQTELQTHRMKWEVNPPDGESRGQQRVVLTFADFPSDSITIFSNEVAGHLQTAGEDKVDMVFDVISDYGVVRGFSYRQIGGLQRWKASGGYMSSSVPMDGSVAKSPFD